MHRLLWEMTLHRLVNTHCLLLFRRGADVAEHHTIEPAHKAGGELRFRYVELLMLYGQNNIQPEIHHATHLPDVYIMLVREGSIIGHDFS